MLRLVLIVLFFFASCSRTITHGLLLNESDISAIIPNLTRKEDVRTLLGSPSFKWNGDWYFVATKKRYKAFWLPTVEKHDLYKISFNGETVTQMQHFTKKDIQNVTIPLYETETQKPDLTKMFK